MLSRTVLVIGNFDGVHWGHQALLRRARESAGPQGLVVAMTFHPHPATIMRNIPDRIPVATLADREAWLRSAGADEVIILESTPELFTMSPRAFTRDVILRQKPVIIVEGADFRFGKDRAGDVKDLARFGVEFGFKVEVAPTVEVDLADQAIVTVSTTLIRWLLEQGRVADAARLLGRPHVVPGPVVEGAGRGRTIGIPTANIEAQTLLPGNGVYATMAILPDGSRIPAAVNIGYRPTMGGSSGGGGEGSGGGGRICEAHLIGHEGVVGHYDWPLRLEFIAFIRREMRFPSVVELTKQIQRDMTRVTKLVSTGNVSLAT